MKRLLGILVAAAMVTGACSGDEGTQAGATTTIAPGPTTTATEAVPSTSEPAATTSTVAATSDTATSDTATTTTVPPQIPPQLVDFPLGEISIDGVPWLVAIADTNDRLRQGLMNVEDLLDLDGMLFLWEEERRVGFWMKDTLIPLDIAFFDGERNLVGVLTMEPCEADPCEVYEIGAPAQYAVEARVGALSDLADGARLVLP